MMVTELRWDFEKIGQTEWVDVVNLLNYWHKTPPLSQLINLYAQAKGLIIKTKGEATQFEKTVFDKSIKLDLTRVPPHLREMIKEVQEGKHVRRRG